MGTALHCTTLHYTTHTDHQHHSKISPKTPQHNQLTALGQASNSKHLHEDTHQLHQNLGATTTTQPHPLRPNSCLNPFPKDILDLPSHLLFSRERTNDRSCTLPITPSVHITTCQ